MMFTGDQQILMVNGIGVEIVPQEAQEVTGVIIQEAIGLDPIVLFQIESILIVSMNLT
jgi:hypothetical protein